MSTKVQELYDLVQKTADRMSVVEKTIKDYAGQRDAYTDVVRKALGSGQGAPNAVGWDGADTLNLLKIGSMRQKAVGWGRYLQLIHSSALGKNVEGIEKSLEKMGSRLVTKTSLAEGSGITGGYTVPVQFYGELLRLVAEDAFIRSMCMVVPMQSRSLQVPALDQSGTPAAGTSAFFGGISARWLPENAGLPESEPNFRQVELTARDLVFYTVASNQLLQDNAVALDTLLTTLFREAMAWFFDYYIFRGNGGQQPLGVINAPSTYQQSRATTGDLKLIDLANMVSRLLIGSQKNACWVMHPSVLPKLIQLTNGATNSPFLIWLNPAPPSGDGGPIAQKMPMSCLGFPIYWSEKASLLGAKADVTLVDFSKQLVGDRLAIQIETSPHVKFLNNQMVWRVVARFDSQPWLNSTIKLADGSTGYEMSNAVTLAA